MIIKNIISLVVLTLLLFLAGCDSCSQKNPATLLESLPDDSVEMVPSKIEVTQKKAFITCLNSTIFKLSKKYPGLTGDLKGVSGNIDYGNYLAGAFSVTDLKSFNALKDKSCIDLSDNKLTVDFDRQTLIFVTVSSTTGADQNIDVELTEDLKGNIYLNGTVSWSIAHNSFKLGRVLIVNTAKPVRTSVPLIIECND